MGHIKSIAGIAAFVFSIAIIQTAGAQYQYTKVVQFTNATASVAGDRLASDANGNVYGTTVSSGSGTIFKIDATTHSFSTIASLNPPTNGAAAWSGLISDSGGNLYGTTDSVGPHGFGTVFEIPSGSNSIITLASFDTIATGDVSATGYFSTRSLCVDKDGNVFGTTPGSTFGGNGTLFEIVAGTHTITTLATFNGANGKQPNAGLIADADGNLYGTTYLGGVDDNGTLFKLDAATHTLSTLVNFTKPTGIRPQTGLVLDSQGNLYGATSLVGPTRDGTIFKLSSDLTTLTVLAPSFGAGVEGDLVCDANGNLFGATSLGTVFELPVGASTPTTLYTLPGQQNDSDGGIIADSFGNLFGTARVGTGNLGSVFELSPVPEPSALLLSALGTISLVLARRRRSS
jgi:uncharacterized repeat protein (TIGR03803 family)